ncbi:unnamed protein product [Plutella xylostella]|uniref:(diamondback moth) hypothetical protein n=1 Tax=Plutella xylostella TaxID=51655 RepID=A0A8S4FS47_PLUXY|nr:unnamed protein product [Plutella xylostella]
MIHYEKIAAAVLAMQCMGYFRIWGAIAKESVASIRYGFRAIYDPSGSTCLVKSKRMARIRRNLQYWWDWLEDRTPGSCSSRHARVLEPASFWLSADRRFLLLAQGVQRLHRYSYLARYTVYDILTTESYPLTPLPDEVGGGVATEGPLLQYAAWTPKGHGLVTVQHNDIYYRPAPRSSTGYRVTDTGAPARVYNGVPDWLYEVYIISARPTEQEPRKQKDSLLTHFSCDCTEPY